MGQTSIPVKTEVRDELSEAKPDGMNWSSYLLAIQEEADQLKQIMSEQTAFYRLGEDEPVEFRDVPDLDEVLNEDGIGETVTAKKGDIPDAEEIAGEVAARFDHTELAEQVARRVVEELR